MVWVYFDSGLMYTFVVASYVHLYGGFLYTFLVDQWKL
jgi:hypothetical protein